MSTCKITLEGSENHTWIKAENATRRLVRKQKKWTKCRVIDTINNWTLTLLLSTIFVWSCSSGQNAHRDRNLIVVSLAKGVAKSRKSAPKYEISGRVGSSFSLKYSIAIEERSNISSVTLYALPRFDVFEMYWIIRVTSSKI